LKQSLLVSIFVIILIVISISAFYAGLMYGSERREVVKTWKPPEKIKAAWIYVGPIGDFGWTYAHDIGRRVVAKLFSEWLETTYVESVSEARLAEVIDNLVAQGYNVIFTTSFEFMEKTIEKAKQYPNVIFFHCSGYKRAPNSGTYFADLYQVYYLNGLIAGALTKTGQIGYVAAHTIPEVVRHINAFAIGAREVGEQLGKNIKIHVIEIGEWFNPDKARQAARTLYEQYNVDVIAFTEDSTAIVEYSDEITREYLAGRRDRPLYVFSHYSPMYIYGPEATVSGQLVRWEVIYIDILAKIKAGVLTPYNLENVDLWYLLNTGAVDLGAHIYENGSVMYINPKYVDLLKNIIVTDKLTGEKVSVYELVFRRYEAFRNAPLLIGLQYNAITHKYESIDKIRIEPINPAKPDPQSRIDYYISTLFEPFTGPLTGYNISNTQQKINIPSGKRLTHYELWTMDWFLEYVIYIGKIT